MTDSLDSLRADFPSYAIHTEPRPAGAHPQDRQASPPGIRFVAVRREDGPGPHTVITPDPDELRTALGQPTQPVHPHESPALGLPLAARSSDDPRTAGWPGPPAGRAGTSEGAR